MSTIQNRLSGCFPSPKPHLFGAHPVSGQPSTPSSEAGGPGTVPPDSHGCRLLPSRTATAWVDRTLRWLVGGTFVLAGVLKIADPAKFALDVGHYRVVPHALVNLVAIVLPWIELTAGVCVLAGVKLRPASLVLTSLSTMFLLVIVSALARGLNIECGCFGTVRGQHVGLMNLAIDAAVLTLSAFLFWRSKPTQPRA